MIERGELLAVRTTRQAARGYALSLVVGAPDAAPRVRRAKLILQES